jgi:ataxia telangiectasia mutated family protein
LLEVETVAKELDYQGPPTLSDAVCAFFCACLRVAAQDVRLYRLQIEDKILSWLVDVWGRGEGATRNKMPQCQIQDILGLLSSVCSLSKGNQLANSPLYPSGVVAETVVEGLKTRSIQDFQLYGRLPPFQLSKKPPTSSNEPLQESVNNDLVQPQGRERRISSLLMKSLESMAEVWERANDVTQIRMTAELARQSVDLAVISLTYEALLKQNGINPNRRVIQISCKLLELLGPSILNSKWTSSEIALVLAGFEPLVSAVPDAQLDEEAFHELLVAPVEGTGMKTERLHTLLRSSESALRRYDMARRTLQRLIFQASDVRPSKFEHFVSFDASFCHIGPRLPI